MRTDYNLYEGKQVTGTPAVVLLRGNVVVDGADWKGSAGGGKFLHRQRFARPGARAIQTAPARAAAGGRKK